jgi:hypothetical protein
VQRQASMNKNYCAKTKFCGQEGITVQRQASVNRKNYCASQAFVDKNYCAKTNFCGQELLCKDKLL